MGGHTLLKFYDAAECTKFFLVSLPLLIYPLYIYTAVYNLVTFSICFFILAFSSLIHSLCTVKGSVSVPIWH